MPQTLGPPAAGDPPGIKKLGRYECAEQVGASSGFETYRARVKGLAGLDRSFAVKVLRLKRSEVPAAVSEPFLQAARRSATLADPHIAKVVEADSGEGLVFAVTPFMDGVDLAQFLQRAREAGVLVAGKGEAARRWHRLVAYIGAEVASGLQVAHAQEPPLVHGALCPGNVFITARGAVRLLDFGLRASVRRPFEPRPRRLLPYIAPELAAPAADATTAGDMHSLGILLFELCNGDLPPQGRRSSDTQIALSLLPEDLGLLIGRLISLSPSARPAAADVVSALAGVYADATEVALVADLSAIVESSSVAPEASAVAPAAVAPEDIDDDAPPPPSEVEHDEAWGLDTRAGETVTPEPVRETADPSVPLASSLGEFGSSHEMTAVGEPALMDDLLAKSRPSIPADEARASPNRGFGAVGTEALDAPLAFVDAALETDSVAAGGWTLKSASGLVPPASAPSANFFSAPEQAPSPGEIPVAIDPGLPSVPAFDAPPATWGARALAALGGQAGIAPSSDSPSIAPSLFDEVQAVLAQPALPDPSRSPSDKASHRLSPPPFGADEPPLGTPVPHESYPMEVIPGARAQVSADEILLPDPEASRVAEPPRGDALLEDELVDSPDGARPTSPWPPPDASGAFGLPGSVPGGTDGGRLPEAVAFADESTPLGEAVAFAEPDTQSAARPDVYLDDGVKPAAAPAYFDDNAGPLPASDSSALPETGAAWTPPLSWQASQPPPGAARGKAVRRPSQTPVPAWAKSPDDRMAKRGSRRLIWVIAGSVLGASVLAGGLAGFLVGARGKPWGALLGGGQPPALSKPRAAPSPAPDPAAGDDTPPPLAGEAKARLPVPGARRSPPAVEAAPSVARKAGADKSAKAAAPAPERKAAGEQPLAPATPDKKFVAAGSLAPTSWGKGIPDSAGQLVSVSVTSQPVGASVWINGKERGRTPLQAKIQAGPAQVVLVLAGHASALVTVTASEGAQVSKELLAVDPPLTGEARFRAECTTQGKLPIVVDGKETGVLCPFTKLRVDPGVHKVGLFVPALGKLHEKEVTLQPGVRSIVFAD